MRNVIILHAMDDTPEDYWYPWLKSQLERKGYEVWIPKLPNADKPSIRVWAPFILKNGKFTRETIIVGHSAGAAVMLSLLEELKTKISQAILVSGFYSYPRGDPIVKPEYDWEKIKSVAGEIIFINSDNDPYGYDDKVGRKMLDLLNKEGGIQITLKGQGHMGTDEFNQPYKKFPFLLRLIK